MDREELLLNIISTNTEATAIKTFACLLKNANDDGIANVSYVVLEKFVGQSKRNISRYIKKFKQEGILEVSKNGNRNVYKIIF
ncbi:helix-turn-helix domain-containing protein [Clostridium perfringens]|uniref:hypothetical protein n=1 Tax=Clostridium perfringens TaxID=1502 RepID=UPI002246813D|nr:hypothetical protein [Clostridium perfringens]EJT5920843.1 hypothetical protein [Clostridium perfringens]MCX0403348.1 hypothetical protein [Clostridium perfringens]MDM0947483.1 hypothetical protein [Clostridium perfringens]